jgi:uncharacterized protein YutE (UPF0331/DUF86 family)
MSRLNEEMVKARAQEIRESLDKVRTYASLPDHDFWDDERNLYTVMHLLLISIESVAALCSHILARLARRAPASYAECFEGLRGLGVLDDELAGSLVQMARFRNLLVHRYWEKDPARVLHYARENLGDFEAYLAAVGRLMLEEG